MAYERRDFKTKSNFPTETDGAVTGESICIGGIILR